MNSREKGKRGERQWRDELRAQGYAARRGQQFSGSPDSPDVVCDDLPWAHFEVKLVERLDLDGAMEQARRDARQSKVHSPQSKVGATSPQPLSPSGEGKEQDSDNLRTSPQPSPQSGEGVAKVPIVAHRRSFRPWLVTMEAETFFQFLRGTLPPESTGAERQELNKDKTQAR